MVRLRELIAAGELGDVRAFFADHTQQLSDDPSHRINAVELGGGALLDLGIYPISYSYELLGTPASVSATAAFKPTGADAQTATVFGYDGGQVATTLSSSVARGPNHATIVGTAGWVEIDTVWYNATSFRRYDDSRCVVESYESAVEGRGMQYQALEAERVIADGRTQSDILPMSDSVAIMGIVDRVRDEIGLRYPGEA
jgi:predicted dehydrogenase